MPRDRFLALFLGDSVVWGQGLREEDKFSTEIIRWLNEYHPDLGAYKAVKAHSGAVIGTTDILDDPAWPGEVPNPYPTIHLQIASYDEPAPDLIVLNGGINDVRIRTIFNPRTTMADLRSLIRYTFGTLMPSLLDAAAIKFPHTKILVPGYYPIVSNDSRLTGVVPMMSAFGWRSAVDKALTFEAESDALIQQAIAKHSGQFIWIKPAIKPENSAFGPHPWVFGVKLPQAGAEDDLAADRRAQAVVQPDCDSRRLAYRASGGHPNRWGARAYFNAIYPVLQREYGF